MILFKAFTKSFFQRLGLRILALFLSFLLVFDSLVFAFPSPEASHVLKDIQIPSAWGKIDTLFNPGNIQTQPFILIQDAHAIPEAQKNIALILKHLAHTKKMERITAEAASGKINPRIFDFISDSAARQAVIEDLAQKGELTGAELYMLQGGKVPLYGIEDEPLYAESFRLFYDVKQAKLKPVLSEYAAAINHLEETFLNRDLQNLIQKQRLWDKHKDENFEYLQLLKELAQKNLGLDLSNARQQFQWPNLTRLFKVQEIEREILRESVSKDIQDLSAALKQELPNLETLDSPRAFFENLYEKTKAASIPLVNYPHFLRQSGIIILRSEIRAASLVQEMQTLTNRLENKMAKNKKEKQVLRLSRDLMLLEKLFSLELSREDHDLFRKKVKNLNPEKMLRRFQGFDSKTSLPLIDNELFKKAEKFYQLTLQRDHQLLKNALQLKTSSPKANVLIAGGFHMTGIQSLLHEKQIPYLVITPQITSFKEGQDHFYENIMLGKQMLGAWFLTDPEPFLSSLGPLGRRSERVMHQSGSVRSEKRGMHKTMITTDLSPQKELELLRPFLVDLKKELEEPGSGDLPYLAIFSDHHGTIDKFDKYILDAMRRARPDKNIPEFTFNRAEAERNPKKKFWDIERSLESQLAPYGVNVKEDFAGYLFTEDLGDPMDRGPRGIRVFERSMELYDAGLSEIVLGNHDYYVMFNLWGFHLPWYEGYNTYAYRDSYDAEYRTVNKLLEHHRKVSPETQTPEWWAEKLADFRSFHAKQQKTKWKALDIRVNGWDEDLKKKNQGKGLYAQVSAQLTPEQNELWNKFRGNANNVDIYTGVRAVGTVSIVWWEKLLIDFKKAYAARQLQEETANNIPANQAWWEAIEMMETLILPQLREDLESHLREGEWWWRVFEAIHAQNYTSAEWLIMDWLYHPGWGPSVLEELNLGITDISKKVTPKNYLHNPTLKNIGQTYRKIFKLRLRDLYQNIGTHAFMPIDMKTAEFHFTYKGQEYRGKGTQTAKPWWEGLDVLARDIRNPENSMKEIYEAITLLLSWYSDNNPILKPARIAEAMNKFGPDYIAERNGVNRMFFGHVPFHEFHKLSVKELGMISGFNFGDHFFDTDHGAGIKFGGRGAYVSMRDHLILRGFEHEKANGIKDHPSTVRTVNGPDGQISEEILFKNPGISRETLLPELISNVETRIAELEEENRSEMRESLPDNLKNFLSQELNIQWELLSEAESQTFLKYRFFFEEVMRLAWWRETSATTASEPRVIILRNVVASNLHSSENFLSALFQAEFFQPSQKTDGKPDKDTNALTMSMLKTALQGAAFDVASSSLSEEAFKIIELVLREDSNEATVLYATEALGNLFAANKVIEKLLLLSSLDQPLNIRNAAIRGLKNNVSETVNYLIQKISQTTDKKTQRSLGALLDTLSDSNRDSIRLLISEQTAQHQEKLFEILGDYLPGYEEWVTSAFSISEVETKRRAFVERLNDLERFKVFLGDKTFQALLRHWGLPIVVYWSEITNYEDYARVIQIVSSLQRQKPAQSAIAESLEKAYSEEDPFLIRSLLLFILQGRPQLSHKQIRELLRLVQKDPAGFSSLQVFLIIYFRMAPVSFPESEFIQLEISKLLHSPVESNSDYFLIRKLAEFIPHPTSTDKGLEAKIKALSEQLDRADEGSNHLFHALRLEIHRKPAALNLHLMEGILQILTIDEYPFFPTLKELDQLLGKFVQQDETKPRVYEALHADSERMDQFISALETESKRPMDENAADQLLETKLDWKKLSPQEKSQLEAKFFMALLQALRSRYQSLSPKVSPEVEKAVSENKLLDAVRLILAERKKIRDVIRAPTELEYTAEMDNPQKVGPHDAWGFFDHWGYAPYSLWSTYKEKKFDELERDRTLSDYQEKLQNQFLTGDFEKHKRDIRKWIDAHELLPVDFSRSQLLPDEIRRPLLEMIEGLCLLIDQMAVEGVASTRLESLGGVLRKDDLDIVQVKNLLVMMQEEASGNYDFFNFVFWGYPAPIALALGQQGIVPRYVKKGDEKRTELEWAKRVQETVIADLWSYEHSLGILDTYLRGLKKLLDENFTAPSFFLRGPENIKPGIVTPENFSQTRISRAKVGSKAFELFVLRKDGLRVPPLVTLPADLPKYIALDPRNSRFRRVVIEALLNLEKQTGHAFPFDLSKLSDKESALVANYRASHGINSKGKVLILSARSGALESMPGMMDTVLDLPFNPAIAQRLIQEGESEAFVYDTFRRFLASFSSAFYGIDRRVFSEIIDHIKKQIKKDAIIQFNAQELRRVVRAFSLRIARDEKYRKNRRIGKEKWIPLSRLDPLEQVLRSTMAIYNSWHSVGAKKHRRKFQLSSRWGTSVTFQQMIFGNRNPDSGTGVIFTSDGEMGVERPMGTWRWGQGDDLVGGLVEVYQPVSRLQGPGSLEESKPNLYNDILRKSSKLERRYRAAQDLELTFDRDLWLLQTRNLVRSGQTNKKVFDILPESGVTLLYKGVPVSPNVAVGRLLDARVMTPSELEKSVKDLRKKMRAKHEDELDVILVFDYVTDDDAADKLQIPGVGGLINSKVGISTHASLVARRNSLAYVSEVDIHFDDPNQKISIGGKEIQFGIDGDIISIDGYPPLTSVTSGQVILGEVPFFEQVRINGNGHKNGDKHAKTQRGESRKVQSAVISPAPARLAISLGGQGLSNFAPKIVQNTLNNRIFDAYLRTIIGDPNISLTDIYGVKDIKQFFASIMGNPYHGRLKIQSLDLQNENGQSWLTINGHRIRVHQTEPVASLLQMAQTDYLLDLSDMDLTGETSERRKSRLTQIQQAAGLKRIWDFRGDEDPSSDVTAPGFNTNPKEIADRSYHALVSPATLAMTHILRVVDQHFSEDVDKFSNALVARPSSGDPGKINFLTSRPHAMALRHLFPQLTPQNASMAAVQQVEYDVEKGSSSILVSLIPKANSRFKKAAKELKSIKNDKRFATDKEKEIRRHQLIYQTVNQYFDQAAQETGQLRYAGEEHLNSLLGIRDTHVAVFDSQATAITEDGQVNLYFHFNDLGYAQALNTSLKEALVYDKGRASLEDQSGFENLVRLGGWPTGTISATPQVDQKKEVAEGDEIGAAIVGGRGRIGRELIKFITANPNYRLLFILGIQSIDTFLLQYQEDVAQGPMNTLRNGKEYKFEKANGAAHKDMLRLRNVQNGDYLLDPQTGEPLLISYYHVKKRAEEDDDAFERRIRETLGDKIDQIEVLFNAAGIALEEKDKYYDAFRDGKKIKRVAITSPAKGEVGITVIRGINEDHFVELARGDSKPLFCSDASCTTTALSRGLVELDRYLASSFGIEAEYFNFITHHGMTPSQGELYGAPSAGKSLRTAAPPNMVAALETTGANKVVVEVRPEFKGRLSGVSHRDGNYGGSVVFVSARVRSEKGIYPTIDQINNHFENLAKQPALQGILSFNPHITSTAQIVGDRTAALFLPQLTQVERGDEGAVVTIALGYDNESGYAQAVIVLDQLAAFARRGIIFPGSERIQSAPKPLSSVFLETVRSLGARVKNYSQYSADNLELEEKVFEDSQILMSRLEQNISTFNKYSDPAQLLEQLSQTTAQLRSRWGENGNKTRGEILDDLTDTHGELDRDVFESGQGRTESRSVLEAPEEISEEESLPSVNDWVEFKHRLFGITSEPQSLPRSLWRQIDDIKMGFESSLFRSEFREASLAVTELMTFHFVPLSLSNVSDFQTFARAFFWTTDDEESSAILNSKWNVKNNPEASSKPKVIVLMNINGRFPRLSPGDLKALELSSESRLVVLDPSGQNPAAAKNWYSKLNFVKGFRTSNAIPTVSELQSLLTRFPDHIPVLLFPAGFSEAVASQYKTVSSEAGFAGILPRQKEARTAFASLIANYLPATALRDIPADTLSIQLNAHGLSPAQVPLSAENRFAAWIAGHLNAQLTQSSA